MKKIITHDVEFSKPAGIKSAVGLEAGQSAIPGDEEGKLPSELMPDEIDVRLSVLGGSRAALLAANLAENELAVNTDEQSVVIGDGAGGYNSTGANASQLTTIVQSDNTVKMRNIVGELADTDVDSGALAVLVGSTVTSLGNDCLYTGGWNVEVLTLPEGLLTMGSQAVNGTKITRVKLPNTLLSIGANCFGNSSNIAELIFGRSLQTIGADGCASIAITEAYFHDALTSIGVNAFQSCTALASVRFPPSLTTIGGSAFLNTALPSVVLPYNALTTIGNNAFQYNPSLVNVYINSDFSALGTDVFVDCASLATIHVGPDASGWTLGSGLTVSGATGVDVVTWDNYPEGTPNA